MTSAGVEPRAASADDLAIVRSEDIETTSGTWHMPLTIYFRTRCGHRPDDFPVTDGDFALSLTPPLYESFSETEQMGSSAGSWISLEHLSLDFLEAGHDIFKRRAQQ